MIAFDRTNPPLPVGRVVAVGDGGTTAVVLDANGDMREVDGAGILVGAFDLPPGIEYGEWSRFHYQYRIMRRAGLSTLHTPDRWRAFATSGLAPVRLWVAVRTVEYGGKSSFLSSLRDQITSWLDTPADRRRFGDPLSKRQWESLLADSAMFLVAKGEVDGIMWGLDLKTLPDALEGAA